MIYCGNCGKQYKEELNFCPHCGTPNQAHKTDKKTDCSATVISRVGEYGSEEESRNTASNIGGKSALNPRNIPIGIKIDGRYEVKEKLGSGDFGTVYKVWDSDADCFKALKLIHFEYYDDEKVIADLKKGTKTLMKIFSDHVVRVWDIHLRGDLKYINMEYLDGEDLVDFKLNFPDNKVPERLVEKIALQLAVGMKEIHKNNVIHKDLKPQNIMLTIDGRIKIMDFGIAETFQSSQSRIKEPSRSETYPYMSPEQLEGRNVGKESDIWSFGIILYELLTGKKLYSGNSYGDFPAQIYRRNYEPVEGISSKINNLLLGCLQTKYKNRFRSFDKIIEYLLDKEESPDKRKSSQKKGAEPRESHHPIVVNTIEYEKNRHTGEVSHVVNTIEKEMLAKAFSEKKFKTRFDILLLIFAIIVVFFTIVYFGIDFSLKSISRHSRHNMEIEMKTFSIKIREFYNTPRNQGGGGRSLEWDDDKRLFKYLGWNNGLWNTKNANYKIEVSGKKNIVHIYGIGKVLGSRGSSFAKVEMIFNFDKDPPYRFKTIN
ncbi:MAG: serine/threonine-protein kinase [Candidatus Stygibacter australis]|nr:serine/threonine-protein kinase [Candidatus Stygibacter australis]